MSCPINTYKNNSYNEVDIEIINGYHNAVVDDLLSYDNLFQLDNNVLSVKDNLQDIIVDNATTEKTEQDDEIVDTIETTTENESTVEQPESNVKSAIAAIQAINYKYNANVVTIKDNGELQVDVSIIEDQILPNNTIYYSKELNNVRTITENLNSFEFKLDLLKKSLPGVEIVFDNTINGKGKVESKNGKIKLSINTDSWTSDTLIHEFGHLYIDILLNDGYINLIENGINQLRGTKLWNDVAKLYNNLDEATLGKEVLATAIGLEGAQLASALQNPTITNKVTSVIESILNAIKRLLGLDQNIARKLAKQLLTNRPLTNSLDGIVMSFQEYHSKRTQGEIVEILTDHQKNIIKNDETHKYALKVISLDNITIINAAESVTEFVKAGKDADFADKARDAAMFNLGIKLGQPITQEQVIAIDNEAYRIQEGWVTGSTLGTNIHQLFEDFFGIGAVRSDASSYFLANYAINRENGKSPFENLTDEQRKQHENNFNKLVDVLRNIKSKHPGGVFLTELKVFELLSDHPRAGTIDLLVINTDGTASIYDFKTSINPVYEIKNKRQVLTSSYMNNMFEKHAKQLYAYAAILKKNFNINVLDFNIVPIHLDIESNDIYKASVANVGPQKMIEINTFVASKAIRERINLEFKVEPSFKVSDKEALIKVNKYIRKQIAVTNTFIESILANRTANVDLAEIRKIANDLETYESLDAIVINIKHLQELYEKAREHYINQLQAYFKISNEVGEYVQMRLEDRLQLVSIVDYIETLAKSTTELTELLNIGSIDGAELDIKNDIFIPIATLRGQAEQFKTLLNEEILTGFAHKLAKGTSIGKREFRTRYEQEFRELNKVTANFGGFGQTYYIGTQEVHPKTWEAARKDYVINQFKNNAQEIYNNSLKAAKAYIKSIPFDIQVEHILLEAGEFNNDIIKFFYNSLKDADINKQQAYIEKRNELASELERVLTSEQRGGLAQFKNPGEIFNKFINGDHLVTKYNDSFLYGEGGLYEMKHNVSLIEKKIKKAIADNKITDVKYLQAQLEAYEKAWYAENTIKGVGSDGKRVTYPALKWLNPQYMKIIKNPKDFELYKVLLKLVIDSDALVNNPSLQLMTTRFNTEFIKLPSFAKGSHESLTESGKVISNLYANAKQYVSKDVSDNEFEILDGGLNAADDLDALQKAQDINKGIIVTTDVSGKTIPNINFPYRGLLGRDRAEHSANISHDLIASLLANYEVSYNYYEKSKMKDDFLLVMSALQDETQSGTVSRGLNNKPTVFDGSKTVKGFNRAVKKLTNYVDSKLSGRLIKADEDTDESELLEDKPQKNIETRWFAALNSVVQQRLLGIKLVGSNWQHNAVNVANTAGAFHTLALNVPSAIANLAQGIYAMYIEAGISTTVDIYAVTKSVFSSIFKESIVDFYDTINSPISTSKVGILLDKFNARDTSSSPDTHILQNSVIFRNSPGQILQLTDRIVNSLLSTVNMKSVLYSIKLKNKNGQYIDKNGKVTTNVNKAMSYYDAIKVKNSKLVYPDYYLPTGEKIDSLEATKIIQKRISEINFKTQGYYQKEGVVEAKRRAWGKGLLSMKSWLASFVNRRLRLAPHLFNSSLEELRALDYINYNEDLETEDVGISTEKINFIKSSFSNNWEKHDTEQVVLKILKTTFDTIFRNTSNFEKLSYDSQRRVIMSNRMNAYITVSGMLSMLMAGMLLVELDDDEKEEFIANVLKGKKKIIDDLKELRKGQSGEYLEKIDDNIRVFEEQLKEGVDSDFLKKYYFNSAIPSVIGKNNPDKYEKIDGKWYNRKIELKYSELEIMGIKPFEGNTNSLFSINNEREYWKYIFSLSYMSERLHDEAAQLTPESIPAMMLFNSGGPAPQKILQNPITATGLIKDTEIMVKNIFGLFDDEANDVFLTNKKSTLFPGTYDNISYTPKDKLWKSIFKHYGMEDYEKMYKTIYGKDDLSQD